MNPDLGNTFREVATKGAVEGFYKGRIAQAIVDACAQFDGVMSLEDLEVSSFSSSPQKLIILTLLSLWLESSNTTCHSMQHNLQRIRSV